MQIPTFETLELSLGEHGIATLWLNRPDKLNAFTAQMKEELIAALDFTDASDAVRAVVVTGRGRAFCAGADLDGGGDRFNYDKRAAPGAERPAVHRDGGGELTLRIFRSLKPVIAAINGPAVGIGATMLLPMDVRLAADDARMGFVFSRRGIVNEAASSWFLSRVVGISTALEWCCSGRVFDAAEAQQRGLVRELHAQADLLPAAIAVARRMTEHSAPVSVAVVRQMIWRMAGAEHPMRAHEFDSRAMVARGRSADAREGIESFLEKRPARFPDRVSRDLPDFFDWSSEPPFQ